MIYPFGLIVNTIWILFMQKNFHERLIELRASYGIPQGELAERLGISRPSIVRYEKGERLPDIDLLVKLHELYKVDMNWLVLGQKETNLPNWQADYTADDLRLIDYLKNLNPKAKQALLAFLDNLE